MSMASFLQEARSRPSKWQFVTSGGVDASVGIMSTGVSHILLKQGNDEPISYVSFAIGAGLGPFPLGASLSKEAWFNKGAIWLGSGTPRGTDLKEDSFTGSCIMMSVSGGFIGGSNYSLIFFGAYEIRVDVILGLQAASAINPVTGPMVGLSSLTGANSIFENAFWNSFAGVIGVVGVHAGINIGISLTKGYIRQG